MVGKRAPKEDLRKIIEGVSVALVAVAASVHLLRWPQAFPTPGSQPLARLHTFSLMAEQHVLPIHKTLNKKYSITKAMKAD